MPASVDTRVGVYCVVVENDRLLLTHIRPGYFGKDFGWTLPGGGIEPFESPEDCARREVLEETGIVVEPTGLLAVRSFTVEPEDRIDRSDRDRRLISVQIIYMARPTGGSLRAEREGSTDEAAWIELSRVESLPRVHLVDFAVQALGRAASETR